MASVEEALIDNEVYDGYEGEEEKGKGATDIKDSRTAWIVCFCAVIDQLFITGLINVFGVFFVEFVKEFGASKGKVAWLGSLSYGLMKLFAPVISIFARRYTNRVSMVIGSAFCAVSVFSTSFAPNIDVMFVTFPFLFGIGTSLVINPVMVIANGYFNKHLGLATGLVCAGSSLGSVTLAPICQRMVDILGWRMTFRCLTGVYICLCFLNLLVKPLPRGSQDPIDNISQPMVRGLIEDLKLWKNRVFVLWATATALVMFGYYIPCVHLLSYAIDQGIPADNAAYLLMGLGGATTIGRLLSGKILQSGFINRLHLHQLTMIITGTAFMILPSITSFSGLLTYVILTGLVDGCYIVLLPILTCALIGADKAVVAWCLMSGFSSLTFTLGPPVSGFLCDLTGTYNVAFHIAGIPVILGAVILFFVPWAQRTATTTNVMRVLSTDIEAAPLSVKRTPSSDSGSSDDTIHLSIPECRPFPCTGLPCFIDPHYGGPRLELCLDDLHSERDTDKHTTTEAPTGGSAPDICVMECDSDPIRLEVPSNIPPHNSAPVFEAYRDLAVAQFISIPRRDTAFIDGYLEELRRAMCTTQMNADTPGLLVSPLPSHTPSSSQARPQQVPSVAVSSITSSMDQLLQEHIDVFLAELAARRVSGMSTSSGISRSASRTQRVAQEQTHGVKDEALSNRSGQNLSALARNSVGNPFGASFQPSQDSRSSGSRTSDLSSGGANALSSNQHDCACISDTQQVPITSSSQLSGASRDSARSSNLDRLRRVSSTSTGGGLDVFSHLFKDEET